MPRDKVIQHVPAEAQRGLPKPLSPRQPACLHTRIIYHNISLRARLLIIKLFPCRRGKERNLPGWEVETVSGVRFAFLTLNTCEGGKAVVEDSNVCVHARRVDFLMNMHKHCWLLYCTVGGVKVRTFDSCQRSHLVSQYSRVSCHLSLVPHPPKKIIVH